MRFVLNELFEAHELELVTLAESSPALSDATLDDAATCARL